MIAYRADRVIDATQDRPIENGVVLVADGRVVSVGVFPDLPGDADLVDLGDATLLPGLVDAHVHLVWSASAEPHEVVNRESRAFYGVKQRSQRGGRGHNDPR